LPRRRICLAEPWWACLAAQPSSWSGTSAGSWWIGK